MSGIQEIFTFSASKPTLVISLHLNNENSIAAYIKIHENLFAHAIYKYLSYCP